MKILAMHPARRTRPIPRPLMSTGVRAGFPSPAEDHLERRLDLGGHLVQRPASTFFLRVKGDSMEGAGVRDGDLLVVDRSCEARDGSVVVAVVEGEFTVKTLRRKRGKAWLEAAKEGYSPITLGNEDAIWGVVLHAVRSF